MNMNDAHRTHSAFFEQATEAVARDLLGKVLVRTVDGVDCAGRIVDVEMYLGEGDRACHAARGRTQRNEVMFWRAGHAYVYFVYGMHYCFNIVTEKEGFPAAVLVRALEPLSGIELMEQRRRTQKRELLTSGPARLTQALGIDRTSNGIDLTSSAELGVFEDGFKKGKILKGPRIGVDYAGKDAKLLWRFGLSGSAFLSKKF